MAVDEQIAMAWEKLHPGLTCDHLTIPVGWHKCLVPDPIQHPLEWVRAFGEHQQTKRVHFEYLPYIKTWQVTLFRLDYGGYPQEQGAGDTPEAALEAVIREWENSQG